MIPVDRAAQFPASQTSPVNRLRKAVMMRSVMLVAILIPSLLFVLPGMAEKAQEREAFTFSLPYECNSEKVPPGTLCLAERIEREHKVLLVGEKQRCISKTADVIMDEYYGIQATRLDKAQGCPKQGGYLAVLDVGPSAVRVITPKDDPALLTPQKEAELRTELKLAEEHGVWPLSGASPKVLRAGKVGLIVFEKGDGALFLLFKGKAIRLDGWCTCCHIFFTINNRLHFA